MSAAMTPVPIVAWIVRWSGFLALAGLVGGFAVDLLVLPPSPPRGGEGRVRGRGGEPMPGLRLRLQALRVGCAGALLVVTLAELWLRAVTMTGGALGAALPAIPAVLTRTHFGAVWMTRAASVVALLLLSCGSARVLRGLGAIVALGVALTVSLTGHASTWGDLSLTAGLDWIHVVAATGWTGGLFVLAAVVVREARDWPPSRLADTMRRFSRLAGWCLLAVLLSGTYATWVQVGSVGASWRTVYGRVLLAKLLLVAGVVWLGAVNRYTVLPRLDGDAAPGPLERLWRGRTTPSGAGRDSPRAVPSRLHAYLTREALLALVVFGCTAILTESTPARHAHHLGVESPMGAHAGHPTAGEPASPRTGPAVSR